MNSTKQPQIGKFDRKELDLPETVFVRDIENKVFQGIVLKCLERIQGISFVEGTFINSILGRDSLEGIRGIHTEQDNKRQCVSIRVEVNVSYGISIPKKAEEIQTRISEEIAKMTGLHVSSIHVVFKNIATDEPSLLNSNSTTETAQEVF